MAAPGLSTPTRSRSPASTRTRINTPPTPRLGAFSDDWEPYSPAPRKSARISSRTTDLDTRTPSPNSSARVSRSTHPRAVANTSAARTVDSHQSRRQSHITSHSDSMTSPPATLSPQKKRQPASAHASASRAVSGSLTAQSIRDAAAALGQSQKMDSSSASASRAAAMALPTPAKTPARMHPEQTDKEVTAIARNLFGKDQQDAPLTVKKTRTAKRNKVISLGDSFGIHDDDAPIEIFTDSENRLPQVDDTTDNPFYGDDGIAAAAVPPRRSARHKKTAAVEKEMVEEKLKREDGLLYVFRGKKVFRKFADADAASRSAVRPRLLFPSAAAQSNSKTTGGIFDDDDEEAETDIEEQPTPEKAVPEKEQEQEPELETPALAKEAEAEAPTPKAPKHAPASPPSTSRATRSKKLILDEHTPVKSKGKRVASGGRSPFDGWRRTKNSPSSSTSSSRKRPGEALVSDAAPKRSKA